MQTTKLLFNLMVTPRIATMLVRRFGYAEESVFFYSVRRVAAS